MNKSTSSELVASITPALEVASLVDISAKPSAIQRLGKKLFLGSLARLRHGELTILIPGTGERHVFGRRTSQCPLHATLEVLHPQTFADAAFGGTVGGGEA